MGIIILVGLARSGKDRVAEYIVENTGYTKYTFSDVLKEMLEEKGMKATKQNMIELGDMLRSQMGMDAVARILNKKINKTDNLVLVGPRSVEEIDFFKQKFPELKIIRVVAREEDRFTRRTEGNQTKEQFLERDKKDIEKKGMQKVLDLAELQINNFGTLEELKKETESILLMIQ